MLQSEQIEIPNSVTQIGEYAFKGCPGLHEIKIPNSVTRIGRGFFESCSSLSSIEISNSVTQIEGTVFHGCTSLKEVHCRIEHIERLKISEDVFDYCNLSECTLYVPVGTGYAYRHHPIFSKFKDIIIEK